MYKRQVPRNSLVENGNKEFFIQVIDPKDNVLGLNQQIQFDEQVLNYSLVSKFNYESASLDVCEFIDGDNFDKGRYVVNVFNSGDLVSTTEFSLK